MNPEVEEPLGDVDCLDSLRLLLASRENDFVHAGAVDGDVVGVLKTCLQIVRIQHRIGADLPQSFFAVHADVGAARERTCQSCRETSAVARSTSTV